MMRRHLMRAVLAPAVGMVLLLASSSQAATVNAAAFLAGCPGPIYISTDTTLTGLARVTGDCTLATPIGVAVGPQINLNKATLSFDGSFRIVGNASSMTVDRSKITTGMHLTLDSLGPMVIKGSRLTANGGDITLPPRNNLAITRSTLAAQGDVTLGGPGGLRDVTDSAIGADGAITIAPGESPASSINLLRSTLSSTAGLTLGGRPAVFSIDGSILEVLGGGAEILIAPGAEGVLKNISNGTNLKARAGSIELGGTGSFLIEDSKLFSGGAPGDVGILVGGRVSATCRRTELRATRSGIRFTGSEAPTVDDCVLTAGGEAFGMGIQVNAGSTPSISASLFQATAGGIIIVGGGALSITSSSLWARHANGIAIGAPDGRTIIDSKLNSPLGPIAMRGGGPTEIAGSKLTAMNAGGILLSGGTAEVDSSLLFTRGPLTIQNFGTAVAASTIKADAGLLTETSAGGNSILTESEVRAASITVRSFDDTTVTDNRLAAAAFEFSAAGTCTSTGNIPDIPCL